MESHEIRYPIHDLIPWRWSPVAFSSKPVDQYEKQPRMATPGLAEADVYHLSVMGRWDSCGAWANSRHGCSQPGDICTGFNWILCGTALSRCGVGLAPFITGLVFRQLFVAIPLPTVYVADLASDRSGFHLC
jgi:hypothetical protein